MTAVGIRWYLTVFGLPDIPKGQTPTSSSFRYHHYDCKGHTGGFVRIQLDLFAWKRSIDKATHSLKINISVYVTIYKSTCSFHTICYNMFPLLIRSRWHVPTSGESISASWPQFYQDCGWVVAPTVSIIPQSFRSVRSFLGNPVKAEKMFTDHYSDKTVIWTGRMHHIQEGIFSKHFMYLEWALQIGVLYQSILNLSSTLSGT